MILNRCRVYDRLNPMLGVRRFELGGIMCIVSLVLASRISLGSVGWISLFLLLRGLSRCSSILIHILGDLISRIGNLLLMLLNFDRPKFPKSSWVVIVPSSNAIASLGEYVDT